MGEKNRKIKKWSTPEVVLWTLHIWALVNTCEQRAYTIQNRYFKPVSIHSTGHEPTELLALLSDARSHVRSQAADPPLRGSHKRSEYLTRCNPAALWGD